MEQRQRRPQIRSVDGFINSRPIANVRPSQDYSPITERPAAQPTQPLEEPKATDTPITQAFNENYSSKKLDPNELKNKKASKTKRGWSKKRKILTSSLVILLVGFGFGAWYGAKILGSLDKAFHGNVFSDVHALFSNVTLKGENQGRVNILIAGDSSDDPGHQGANLTDSIMVLSIDTKTHTGFMLSVPRDLWVQLPGYGHAKINTANTVSNFSAAGYPSGGMGQLDEIVQTDLGIPIDYYALLNYQSLKQAVDAVGGITINLQSPDPQGIYDAYTHLKLPNGDDTLDGQEALDLARARGDDSAGDVSYGLPNSDFDRTQHQRQMLVALAQKAKTAGVYTNPIKVSKLFDAFGSNIQTNMDLQDVLRFVQITKGMNMSGLQSLTYSYGDSSNDLISDYTSNDGEEALAPSEGVDSWGQIQQYYQQLTSNNPVVREAPSIVILNGSNTDGLAHKMSQTLSSEGFNVVGVTDATNEYTGSMIIDNTSGQKPAAKQLLQTTLPKDTTSTTSSTSPVEATEAQGYNADFVVVLGDDTSSMQQP
jgi:LCP family protein required for cell wall assembly